MLLTLTMPPDRLPRLAGILHQELGIDPTTITSATRFVEDLGCDEVDLLDIVLQCEEAFELEIPDADADAFKTVGGLLMYLDARLAIPPEGGDPMTKGETLEAAATGDGCLGRSRADEPVFVLTARDAHAPAAVRAWADAYEMGKFREAALDAHAKEKVQSARNLAHQMETWRAQLHGELPIPGVDQRKAVVA